MTSPLGNHAQNGASATYGHRGRASIGRLELRQGWGKLQPRCNEPPRQPGGGIPSVRSMFCPIMAIGLQPTDRPCGDDVLLQIRQNMYDLLEVAFDEADVGWADCMQEGRGDVVVIAVPPDVPAEILLDQLVTRLRAGLRLYNKLSSEIAQIRLRLAVHVGYSSFSATGMTGYALSWLTELLDAPDFVRDFIEAATDLGLIASDYLYDELIRHGPGLIDPATYYAIKVPGVRTQGCAWVHFPALPPRPVRPAPSQAREVALRGHPRRQCQRSDPSQVTATVVCRPPESVNVIVS